MANITSEMARAELAKRELARRGIELPEEDEEQGFFNKLPRNLAAGVLEMGRGFANTPHNIANLFGKGDSVPNLADPEFDYRKAVGLRQEPTLSDKLIQGLAEYAPSLALGGAELGLAGEALGNVPKVGKFAKSALEQAASQGLYGATQNRNPLEGAAESAAGSLAGSGLGALIEKGVNALKPSKMFRGELSPEQLAKNLQTTKETNTNLGSVIESPTLKRLYENVLPHIMGSGTYKQMAKNASNIQKTGSEIINKFEGSITPENYGKKIQEALNNAANDVEKIKMEKFNKVNKIADAEKVYTDRTNLRKEASSLLQQIKGDPDLSRFMDASDKKLLQDLAFGESKTVESNPLKSKKTYEGNVDIQGNPIAEARDPLTGELINPSKDIKGTASSIGLPTASPITGKPYIQPHKYSLKNTDILRGKVGEKAYEASFNGQKNKAQIYNKLKKALETDVDEAIKNSSSKELKSLHKDAMDYYRNEYAQYKDKDIQKFIRKGGDPDLILSHFIKGGKNDRATMLLKLSKAVQQQPNGTDNILASSYLSRSLNNEGQLDPIKLSTLYHNLGKNQQKALFGSGDMHKTIKNYVDLVGKNKEGFNLMFNANNGQRNIDLLAKVGQMSASLAHGGGAIGFLAPLVGLGASAKVLTKVLSSPTYREKLVESMIKNEKIQLPKTKAALQKGSAITPGLSGNDEQQSPMELELTQYNKA